MAEAKLTVEAQIDSVIKALQAIQAEQKKTSEGFKEAGKQASENLAKQSKATETNLEKMRAFGNRVLNQLMQDFKALGNVASLAGGLTLADQFRGTLRQSAELTDMIAKLGARFGVAGSQFDEFKARMTRGLGEIGVGSDAAARALEGVAQTNVTAADAAIEYAKQASMLASIGRDQGQEGTVATGLGRIVQEAGFQPNDVQKLQELSASVAKLVQASGMSTTQALNAIQSNYESMTPEQRKRTGFGAASQVAMVQRVTPEGADFLRNYMAMPEQQRLAMDAQVKATTGRSLFGKDGQLDTKALVGLSNEFSRRGLDVVSGAATITGDESSAKALVKLVERAQDLDKSFEMLERASGSVTDVYRKNMGIGEAFNANINRVKSGLSSLLDTIGVGSPLDLLRGGLSRSSESDAGAAGVVLGGAAAAAVLTGAGMRGIGGMLGFAKGEAQERLIEATTGEQVQKVRVVNPGEIGDAVKGTGFMDMVKGGATMLGKGAMVTGAFGVGYAAGEMINEATGAPRYDMGAMETLTGAIEMLAQKLGMQEPAQVRVDVQSRDPGIKAEGRTMRGMAQ